MEKLFIFSKFGCFFFFPLWRNFCVLFSSNPHPSSPVRKFISPQPPPSRKEEIIQTRAKNILFLFFVKSITIQKKDKKKVKVFL
jgi:hypothetical protein